MKDLHIHIERGPYTVKWIEKFIDKAVKMDLDEINLLEHTIRFKEFLPTFEEAKNYNLYQKKWVTEKSKTAHTLDEYKYLIEKISSRSYPIKVSFGLEVCYFEQHIDLISKLVDDNHFDYILGSVHWVDNWTFNQRKYQWLDKDVDKIYQRYFEMENSLIDTGIFDVLAHPDLITCHNIFPKFDLNETYDNLTKHIAGTNMMLEMNTSKGLGINKDFFEIAKNNNVKFSTGSDAHCVENVGKNILKVSNMIK